MPTLVRRRIPKPLSWLPETADARGDRRSVLCQLDGLLTQLEDTNLRGGPVPRRIVFQASQLGIPIPKRVEASALMDAVFLAQEAYLRQQVVINDGRSRSRRRAASRAA